jgi:hypothetical protein
MRRTSVITLLPLAVAVGGCSSHVLFVEQSHVGLKATFEPNQPTPAEVDLGWRRAVFTMIPQKSRKRSDPTGRGYVRVTRPEGKSVKVEVKPDPNELMSVYAVFRANVGFGDPVCVHHFLATGVAATTLLANEDELRALSRSLDVKDAELPCRPSTKAGATEKKEGE